MRTTLFPEVVLAIACALGFTIVLAYGGTAPIHIATTTLAAKLVWSFGGIGVPFWLMAHISTPLSWLILALIISAALWGILSLIWRYLMLAMFRVIHRQ